MRVFFFLNSTFFFVGYMSMSLRTTGLRKDSRVRQGMMLIRSKVIHVDNHLSQPQNKKRDQESLLPVNS